MSENETLSMLLLLCWMALVPVVGIAAAVALNWQRIKGRRTWGSNRSM